MPLTVRVASPVLVIIIAACALLPITAFPNAKFQLKPMIRVGGGNVMTKVPVW